MSILFGNVNVIQLTNSDGNHSGLYLTARKDVENFQSDFDAAFSDLEVDDVHLNADDWLATHKQIYRIFAETVSTDAI